MPILCKALGPAVFFLSPHSCGGCLPLGWTLGPAPSVVSHVPHSCKDRRPEVVSVWHPQPCPFSPGPVLRSAQAPRHCGGVCQLWSPKTMASPPPLTARLHPIPAHRVCSHTGWSSLPFCVTPCMSTGPHSYVLTSCRVFGSSISPGNAGLGDRLGTHVQEHTSLPSLRPQSYAGPSGSSSSRWVLQCLNAHGHGDGPIPPACWVSPGGCSSRSHRASTAKER